MKRELIDSRGTIFEGIQWIVNGCMRKESMNSTGAILGRIPWTAYGLNLKGNHVQ
jgi:hypothetical protein